MEAKHTPKPWSAHTVQLGAGLPYTPVIANTMVAKVYSEAFGDHAQSEANARLIAAAPELLEALQHVLDNFAAYLPAEDAARVRDAIAKATGK